MMPALDVFALALIVLSTAALGLMIVIEASRISVLSGRQSLLRKRLADHRRELGLLRGRVEEAEEMVRRRQEQRAELDAQRARVVSLAASIQADKIELVHELGGPDPGSVLYQCVLRTAPDFGRIDPRNMIFARDIWQRKNCAHIWAESPDAAHAALLRAFHPRSGVLPGRIERFTDAHPEPPRGMT
ncbi:MAG TPA: hypothetical protein VD995_20965 [Azospirillum sp.]|nr:hypothetical protein [Azospirillum sp.]